MFTNDEILNLLAMMNSDDSDSKRLSISIINNYIDEFTDEYRKLIILCSPYDYVWTGIRQLHQFNLTISDNMFSYGESY